jgi:single-strand DNA-binding protein
MLRVTLLGNLGADPEVRYSQKGTQVVSFRVAVNQVRTGRDGERQENTEWFRVTVMGRSADFAQRLNKGSRVLVVGRLDISHFQSKDGEPRTGFDVWADEVQSMSPRTSAYGADPDGAESEQDPMEPAMAGVSSLSNGSGTNGSNASNASNGRAPAPGRARPSPRSAPPSNGGDNQDLEDLPF